MPDLDFDHQSEAHRQALDPISRARVISEIAVDTSSTAMSVGEMQMLMRRIEEIHRRWEESQHRQLEQIRKDTHATSVAVSWTAFLSIVYLLQMAAAWWKS